MLQLVGYPWAKLDHYLDNLFICNLSKNLNLNWIRPIIEEGDVIYHSLEIVHASFDSNSNIPRLSIDLRFSASAEDHDPRWSNPWRGDDGL